jgi:hypothetical protein
MLTAAEAASISDPSSGNTKPDKPEGAVRVKVDFCDNDNSDTLKHFECTCM